MSEPDWTLWGRQLQRLVDDVATMKEDITVLAGEMRGMANKFARLDDRVRRTELKIDAMSDAIGRIEGRLHVLELGDAHL